jgi:hypothetical protein
LSRRERKFAALFFARNLRHSSDNNNIQGEDNHETRVTRRRRLAGGKLVNVEIAKVANVKNPFKAAMKK